MKPCCLSGCTTTLAVALELQPLWSLHLHISLSFLCFAWSFFIFLYGIFNLVFMTPLGQNDSHRTIALSPDSHRAVKGIRAIWVCADTSAAQRGLPCLHVQYLFIFPIWGLFSLPCLLYLLSLFLLSSKCFVVIIYFFFTCLLFILLINVNFMRTRAFLA